MRKKTFLVMAVATADKNGEVWDGGMETDRIMRVDPKTGQFTEYPLPRQTNLRGPTGPAPRSRRA
jgi:streptogramin lyase